MQNRKGPIIVLTVLCVAFILGTMHVLRLRFEAGDIYPPYSSLRADPLGTKALYESIDGLDTLATERNYRSFARFGARKDATLLFLGLHPARLDDVWGESVRNIESFVSRGGRLVIAFFPVLTGLHDGVGA
ncbi:MAG: DUF4350 domain-containing protein [Pseudomonadota bacterium]